MALVSRGGIDIDQIALAWLSGNTASEQLATTTAAPKTNGNLAKWQNGNIIDGGVGAAWTGEVPTGALNGTNKVFTLSGTPVANTLDLFLNITQRQGTDFTLSGVTLTFTTAPKASDAGWFFARYQT